MFMHVAICDHMILKTNTERASLIYSNAAEGCGRLIQQDEVSESICCHPFPFYHFGIVERILSWAFSCEVHVLACLTATMIVAWLVPIIRQPSCRFGSRVTGVNLCRADAIMFSSAATRFPAMCRALNRQMKFKRAIALKSPLGNTTVAK
jgi:hypothetical protein